MNILTRLGAVAALVIAGVLIGLAASGLITPASSQRESLPPVFTVGATVRLDFGSPWRIEEIHGEWLRVTDASSEPQYSGFFWMNSVSGRIWAVK